MKDLTYVQTLPFLDITMEELENPQISLLPPTEVPLPQAFSVRHRTEKVTSVTDHCSSATFVSLADFVYSRVIARTIKTFWPNRKKNPNYVLAYVQETLECGHIIEVIPTDAEKLVARKRQCHECQKFFGGLDFKKVAQSVRAARAKKQTGKTDWSPAIFALGTCLVLLCLLIRHTTKTYVFAAPTDSYRILEQITGYEFVMQRVHEGRPQLPELKRFCQDYRPRFEPGMSLIWFAYDDMGECISIAGKNLGYVIDRGPDHWPKLAKNCRNPGVSIPVVCDGKPRFE